MATVGVVPAPTSAWRGKRWIETVAPDSRNKAASLLSEAGKGRAATPREFVEIRAACLQKIRLGEMDGIHCIEAEVALPFVGGHAFIRGLGFVFAGVCPGRAEDGGCFIRYVRVKDGVRVVAIMRNASARARRPRRRAKERVWTSCLGALTFGPAVGRWTIV